MVGARLTAAAGHLWTPWTQYPSAAAAAVHRCSYMFLQSRPAQQNPKRGVVSLQRKAHERKLNSHLLGLISKFQKKLLHYHCAEPQNSQCYKKSQYISENISEDLTKNWGEQRNNHHSIPTGERTYDYWKDTDKTQKVTQIKTMEDGIKR